MQDPVSNSWTLKPDPLEEMTGPAPSSASFVAASRALVGIVVRSIEAAEVGVTVVQHRVLVALDAEGDLSVGALAALLGVNPSNASRMCDRLERMGVVERIPSEEDGRTVTIHLTGDGRRIVEVVNGRRRDEIAEILGRMPRGEARRSVAAMQAFADAARREQLERSRAGE
jgi:DNA-binding MarR family transcriptional regulator